VPTLTIAPLATAPNVSAFTGNCSSLGFASTATGSFSSPSVTAKTGQTFTEKATFWVGYTQTAFYYCAEVQTPDIHSSATGPASPTYNADDMEFWLAPTNDRAAARAPDTYQILANALGGWNNTQGTGTNQAFNFSWKSGAQVKSVAQGTVNGGYGKATGWDELIMLPWAPMGVSGPPAAGNEMGFNTGGCILTSAGPCKTTLDWVPGLSTGNWHTPALWGELKVAN
jgi:hypothetical protein